MGDSIKVQVLKTYFPEEFGYEPFGDPFESKRRFELERRRKEKPKANGHGIPTGTYLNTCAGCRLESEGSSMLTCTHCLTERNDVLNRA